MSTTGPAQVVRLGTRFINRILIPADTFRTSDWLTTAPALGNGVPEELTEMFMRVVVREADTASLAVVAMLTEPSDEARRTPVVLDIDAFRPVSLGPREPQVWEVLDGLRHLKNKIFFNSITETTKELFR